VRGRRYAAHGSADPAGREGGRCVPRAGAGVVCYAGRDTEKRAVGIIVVVAVVAVMVSWRMVLCYVTLRQRPICHIDMR